MSYFGRPADVNGLRNFTGQLAALDSAGALTNTTALSAYAQVNPGSAVGKLVASFNAQPEAIPLYGSGSTIVDIAKFVNAVYNNVLHRDADIGGANFWVNEIVAGRLGKANVALAITQGALENSSAQGLRDAALVRNTAAAAADFTTSLDTPNKASAFSGDVAAGQARAMLKLITATTDAATVHAAVVAAINVLAPPPPATILFTSGIDALAGSAADEVFSATSGGYFATTTWNRADSVDGGGGADTLLLTDTVGVVDLSFATVSNIQNAVVRSSGGLAANAADLRTWTGLASVALVLHSTSAATVRVADSTALALNDQVGAIISGGSTVSVTAGSALLAAAILLDRNTTVAMQLSVNATGAQEKSDEFARWPVAAADAARVAAQVPGGAAGVSAAIYAAYFNAHNAALRAAIGSDVTIAGDAITAASVSGGGVITIGDNGKGTLNTVTLSGAQGVATLTGSALTNVILNGTANVVTINNSTNGHTQTITLNGALAGTAIFDSNPGTVYLNGTGAASNGVYFQGDFAKVINFTGDKDVAFIYAGFFASFAREANITGAGGVNANFMWGLARVAVITATASTGANTLDIDQQQTYFGGAGVDTITIVAAPLAPINGGLGTADVLVVNIAGGFNASANRQISGFETLALGRDATGTYDATGFNHLQIANAVAGQVTFSNVGGGVDLAFGARVNAVVGYSLANAAGAADVLNVSLRGDSTIAVNNVLKTAGVESIHITTRDSNAAVGHAAFAGSLSVSDSALATLTLSGDMGLSLIDTVDTAITAVDATGLIAGGFGWLTGALSASTAAVTIKGSAVGGDRIDASAVVGKGVTIIETAGANTITGSSTVGSTLVGGGGADTITGGAGNDVIAGGGGADVIAGGAGADQITVAGGMARIVQAAGASGLNSASAAQASESTTTFDIIKGLAAGARIDLGNAAIGSAGAGFAAANLAAGGDNSAVFAAGTYDAAAGTFSYAASGLDTALTYDALVNGTHFETIILVGYHATGATVTIIGGVVTL